MITEKDIQTRTAEILANAGFNVVASEVEGIFKTGSVCFCVSFRCTASVLRRCT